MLDLIIRGGTVFNARTREICDIGISGGRIACLGDASYWGAACEEIDATGCYVMPGMLDSHAHIASPGPFPSLDDYHSGTIAAACGGTTTLVDFAFICRGETPRSALERKLSEARGRSVIDYAFHPCINSADEQSIREIQELLEEGFPSIKMFTVYRDSLMLEAGGIYRVMRLIAKQGGIAMVHAENADLIEYLTRRDVQAKRTAVKYHPGSRPPVTEVSAMASVIEMSVQTGAPVIFAHVSAGAAGGLIDRARREIPYIYAETCPHYLILTEAVYRREDGCKFVCNPPIRSEGDRAELWEMIRQGQINVVNSDHTDFSYAQKLVNMDFYPDIPGGLPSIEIRGMALFSEGVVKGRISMNRFVELTSTNVAKLMGLYPRKGCVAIGSDADVTIIEPAATWTCRAAQSRMRTDYSPYEGMEMTGTVRDTIVRGHVIVRNREYVGGSFRGTFLKRGGIVFPNDAKEGGGR